MNTSTLATGTRVKINGERGSVRYFVLDIDGDSARLVGTYVNGAAWVGEANITTVDIDRVEIVEQFKTGLHSAWVAYAGTENRVEHTYAAIKAGKAAERRDRARQFRF